MKTYTPLKVLKGNILKQNMMLFLFYGESRWSKLCILERGSEPQYVFVNNTCDFMSPHTGRKCRNSPWVLCPEGYEKFTLQPGVSVQQPGCLISDSTLISLFYPRRLLSVCPVADSEPNTALLTFWQISKLRILFSVLSCFWLQVVVCTVTVLYRSLLAQ